jgi:chromosome partitioning protein
MISIQNALLFELPDTREGRHAKMKLISTLNFKGGVGKTTVTWLLARYLVERKGKTVLVVDADPQMSLTTAVQLLEAGFWDVRFENWYKVAKAKGATLHGLLEQYNQSGNISTNVSPFYVHRPNLFLLPSDEEVYWHDLEAPRGRNLVGFAASLLSWIDNSGGIRDETGTLRQVDYCLADCPPAFNSLSFSIVAHSNLVLIPVNPDVFASRGVIIMLNGLLKRMKPLPHFLVFMNRAKSRVNKMTGQPTLTNESRNFLNEVRTQAVHPQIGAGVPVALLEDVYIPERKGIKDALAARQRIPPDLETYFAALWDNMEDRYFVGKATPRTPQPSVPASAVAGLQVQTADALKDSYEELQKQFQATRSKAVDDFVEGHPSGWLDEFIKANGLPIPTKASKQQVKDALLSILAQGRAIGGDT